MASNKAHLDSLLFEPSDEYEKELAIQSGIVYSTPQTNAFASVTPVYSDTQPPTSKDTHNRPHMSMTREELEAHLKAQGASTEASIARHSGQVDAQLGRFEERISQAIKTFETSRADFRQDRIDFKNDLNSFKADVKADLSEQQKNLKADGKSTRNTIIITAVATVLSIAAFNATVLSNMVASFESGRNTADAIAKATDQLRQSQELAAKTAESLRQTTPASSTVPPGK